MQYFMNKSVLLFSKQISFYALEGITQAALELWDRNLCVKFINNWT